ncbi:putative fasciculation and elongation protein zeta-2-like [Scophthalmus maximus]|uniref:Putative fasciculation and elongation protein zeta-2-like n=1 Tax=Scophthalmus maximus TaxID=52904 RepID=A0A2U9AZ58_SCOMX|nr:putative fasciculation and elongation protein zeta-2-like [Scophthalmus maximus]
MAAPVAHPPDDWPRVGDVNTVSEPELPRPQRGPPRVGDGDRPERHDGSFSPAESAGAFRSTEHLVARFDEALSACFRHRRTDVPEELSDDEELREQLDMHSIVVSCLADEPLFTAEQVIEEIEEMMQDSPDMEAEYDPSQSDLSMLSLDVQRPPSSPSYKDSVRTLSVAELNERLEEMETNIRRFSEELVQQLALRDELDFEKEVKNSFISALIDVQNRQKEHRELLKKKKKLKGGAGTSQGHADRTLGAYLTTVIPYEKKGHPPSLEDLQILTKILLAMRDDSDKVPSLLTDYILKVLCPT